MFRREIEECEHRIPVAGQASNGLWVFDAILPGENRQRRVSFLARSGVLNIVRIRFYRRGHLPGKTVQHIRHLMHPTPLMSCAWKRLIQRVPEPHGTICDCNFRCAGQAATFDIGQELMPVLSSSVCFPAGRPESQSALSRHPLSRQ